MTRIQDKRDEIEQYLDEFISGKARGSYDANNTSHKKGSRDL